MSGKSVRVLQVVTRLAMRGVPWHVLELASRLGDEGFDVDVVAGREEPNEGSLRSEFSRRGIRVHYVKTLQRSLHPIRDMRAYLEIRRLIDSEGFGVVHTHISKAGVLGRLAAARSGGVGIVHTYHGRIQEFNRPGIGRVLLAAERAAARRSTSVIAVSEDVKAFLHEKRIVRHDQSVHVIHNGVDLEYLAQAPTFRPSVTGAPVLGAVGALTFEKGVDVLLDAVAGMVEAFPEVQLALIGDGPLRPRLVEQAERLGITKRVHFVGNVTDVRPWVRAFDVLVLPSRSEGMGRVVLEAMAMEVPIVASATGGVPEAIRDGVDGLLVVPGDPLLLIDAVRRLFVDPVLRGRLVSEAAAQVARRFGIQRMVQETAAVYQRVAFQSQN